jgi:hypothetical protein
MKGPDKNKAADKGKATAVIDRSKAGDMNMMVLKRIDPQTEEVNNLCLHRHAMPVRAQSP